WGVPKSEVIGEDQSRDTFESAVETQKLLKKNGWKRYLLVTSAIHMPRSLLVFSAIAPEPIPAAGDFSLAEFQLTPLDFFPNEHVAYKLFITIHEYFGLANYYWRLNFTNP
ncbi:MAG TPA: YdcF family protein, partial [Candidatus Binatia bacterium]